MITNGQFEQLKMFMTPMEVAKSYQPNPNDRFLHGETYSAAWDRISHGRDAQPGQTFESDREVNVRKWRENEDMRPRGKLGTDETPGPNLNGWVASHGQIPGSIHLAAKPGYEHHDMRFDPAKGVIADGHHRIAAARAADPSMLMPVIHHETMMDSTNPELPTQWRARR